MLPLVQYVNYQPEFALKLLFATYLWKALHNLPTCVAWADRQSFVEGVAGRDAEFELVLVMRGQSGGS